ncbi:hypothetical protein AB1283_04245 [Bacillus sp. S13(2024)]|uniref:hypothetical protein n=1 Tax=unclassified Bacillus (in: firmicutes) TaxID=185979 RepID=UPI003D1DB1C8
MIDIREHGGNFGGGNLLKPIGNELSLLAGNNIKKGEFVGLYSDINQPTNAPTFTYIHTPYDYMSPNNYSLDFSKLYSLTSDSGKMIMLRTYNASIYVLKPYYDANNKLSAKNYAFSFDGMIYSVTKLDGNTFAIFHANKTDTSTGVTATIIRIDDITGQPIRIKDIVLFSDIYYKTFYYIPMSDNNLTGFIIYGKGNNSYGYGDNTTTYYGKISVSSDFSSISILSSNNTIKYTPSEAYGFYYNIRYSDDGTKLFFMTVNADYSLDWNNGTPILTVLKSTGATNGYSTLKSFIWFNGSSALTFDFQGAVFKYSHNKTTNEVTKTTIGTPSVVYKLLLGQLMDTVDRKYMTKGINVLNPQAKNIIKPVGNNAFITVAGNEGSSSPPTQVFPIIYYFSSDMNSLLAAKRSVQQLISFSDYIDGTVFVNIDDNLKAEVFGTQYSYYSGSGSFRAKISAAAQLSAVISPAMVISKPDIIHGIALKNATQGSAVKCILSEMINSKFLLGG